MAQPLVVEWDCDFSGNTRLQAVALALDSVVRDTSLQFPDEEDVVVLRISIVPRPRERHAPSERQVTEQTSEAAVPVMENLPSCDADPAAFHALVAQDGVILLTSRRVLRSSFVEWLRQHNLDGVLTVLGILGVVGMFLAAREEVPTTELAMTEEGVATLVLPIMRPGAVVFGFVMLWSTTALLLHRTSTDLLMLTVQSFDVWVLLASCVLREGALCSNRLTVGLGTGVMTSMAAVLQIMVSCFITIPLCCSMSNIDALLLSRRFKLFCCSVFFIACVAYYVHRRFFSAEWSAEEICVLGLFSSARNIHLVAQLNQVLFACKVALAYLSGREFATLATDYRCMLRPRVSVQTCIASCLLCRAKEIAFRVPVADIDPSSRRDLGVDSESTEDVNTPEIVMSHVLEFK
mmetsp:Transcript_44128/g.140229  ORF Transcript_44128/g.140229 Transcript_44128/m.140229 type:complete len:406 (-) Transcript_44128:51-1268(-)